jgi:hypothetical protein
LLPAASYPLRLTVIDVAYAEPVLRAYSNDA